MPNGAHHDVRAAPCASCAHAPAAARRRLIPGHRRPDARPPSHRDRPHSQPLRGAHRRRYPRGRARRLERRRRVAVRPVAERGAGDRAARRGRHRDGRAVRPPIGRPAAVGGFRGRRPSAETNGAGRFTAVFRFGVAAGQSPSPRRPPGPRTVPPRTRSAQRRRSIVVLDPRARAARTPHRVPATTDRVLGLAQPRVLRDRYAERVDGFPPPCRPKHREQRRTDRSRRPTVDPTTARRPGRHRGGRRPPPDALVADPAPTPQPTVAPTLGPTRHLGRPRRPPRGPRRHRPLARRRHRPSPDPDAHPAAHGHADAAERRDPGDAVGICCARASRTGPSARSAGSRTRTTTPTTP